MWKVAGYSQCTDAIKFAISKLIQKKRRNLNYAISIKNRKK